uniref:Transmembrane protein 107 n=1 Tax=Cyprinus carpio TaxID=7962 RepID=A0A8C1PDM8_CYPCA
YESHRQNTPSGTLFVSKENKNNDFIQQFLCQRLVVALSVTLGLFAVELVGFLCGVSMFNNNQALLSIGCHASGSVALLFFLFEQWTCSIYWWIFGFCSVIPALYEMVLFVVVFGFKRKPL